MPTFLSFEFWKPRLARDLPRLVKRRVDLASLRAMRWHVALLDHKRATNAGIALARLGMPR